MNVDRVGSVTSPSDPGGSAVARGGIFDFVALWSFVCLLPILRLATQSVRALDLVLRLSIASTAVALFVVVAVVPRLRPGLAVPVVAALFGIAPLAIAGKIAGGWSVLAAGVALWGVYAKPPLRVLPSPSPPASKWLFGLGLAAALFGRLEDNWVAPVYLLAGGVVVVVGFAAPRVLATLDRAIGHVATWIGTAFGRVGLWFLAFGLILLPWMVQRVLRWDPMWFPETPRSRWIRRSELAVGADEPWFRDPAPRAPVVRRLHSAVVVAATTAILGSLAVSIRDSIPWPSETDLPEGVQAVQPRNDAREEMVSQPWFAGLSAASNTMYDQSRISQYVGSELPDLTSPDLNISQGRRTTWRPEPTACPRLSIWMFGGSALFGVGQRDGHTVSSELARIAEDSAIALDVENWGVPGDVSWQQLRRLERAVTRSEDDRPDLVIFYDGFNDLWTTSSVSGLPWVEPGEFVGPLDRIHMRALTQIQQSVAKDQSERELTLRLPADVDARVAVGTATAVRQYASTDDLARRLLASFEIPFVHVVQPMLSQRERPIVGEPEVGDGERKESRKFASRLPTSVVDLSDPFGASPEPLFVDSVHVSERGNEIVAEVLFDELEPQLSLLLAGKAGKAGKADTACS